MPYPATIKSLLLAAPLWLAAAPVEAGGAKVPSRILAEIQAPAHRGQWGRSLRRLLDRLAARATVDRQVVTTALPTSRPARRSDAVLRVRPAAESLRLELWMPGATAPRSVIALRTDASPDEIDRAADALLVARPQRPGGAPHHEQIEGPQRARLLLGATFSLGGGDGDRIMLSSGLDASVRLRGSLRLVLTAGYLTVPGRKLDLHFLGLPLRAGLAWRADDKPFTVRLTGLVQPVWVRGGPETVSTTLYGLGATLLYTHVLTRWLEGVLAMGGDLYFNRQEFTRDGAVLMTTEQAAAWATAGLRVTIR